MLKPCLIAAGFAAAVLMPAAAQAQNSQNSQQTRSANAPIGGVLTVFGNDPCPADTICIRAPESDRYRIPTDLRQSSAPPQVTESWATRAPGLLQNGNRTGIGSCTTVGVGGSTGCTAQQITAAKAEARQREEQATNLPLP